MQRQSGRHGATRQHAVMGSWLRSLWNLGGSEQACVDAILFKREPDAHPPNPQETP